MNFTKLRAQLVKEEGYTLSLYKDTVGAYTIGVGHNLSAKGISKAVETLMFAEDVQDAQRVLTAILPEWLTFDDVRQRAFVSLAFNLGNKLAQFHDLIAAARVGDWKAAAAALENSKWFKQVGIRGPRICKMLLTGEDPPNL